MSSKVASRNRARDSEKVISKRSHSTLSTGSYTEQSSIDLLGLSVRSTNALKRAGIMILGELLDLSDERLWRVRNIGEKSIEEIKRALAELNLSEVRSERSQERPKREESAPNSEADNSPAIQLSSIPLGLAAVNPEVLAAIPIKALNLMLRTQNVLKHAHVTMLSHLLALSDEELRNVHNLGPETFEEIKRALKRMDTDQLVEFYLMPMPRVEPDPHPEDDWDGGEAAVPDVETLSPAERVEQLLSKLNAREAQILKWRYGWEGKEPRTLEACGEELGVTRERVRQIQKKAISRILHPLPRRFMKPLVHSLEQYIELQGGVVAESVAAAHLGSLGENKALPPAALLEITLLFSKGRVERVKKLPVFAVKHTLYERYFQYIPKTLRRFERVLKKARAPLPQEALLEQFQKGKAGQALVRQLPMDFLLACLHAHPEVEPQEGGYGLRKWRNTIVDDIIVVLRQHDEAIHYSDLAKRVNERLEAEDKVSARNVHAKLGHYSELFVRVGHGIFGLAEWGLPRDGSVADAAHRVLCEAGHALEIEQLTDRVLETWHVNRGSVRAAVDLDERFAKVGHNLYWLSDTPEAAEVPPTDDFDAVLGHLLAERQESLQSGQPDPSLDEQLDELRRLGTNLFD